MKALTRATIAALIAMVSVGSCSAQSLADVARQQQTSKKSQPARMSHVITNDNLGSSLKGENPSPQPDAKKPANKAPETEPAQVEDHPSAEEIQSGIKAQRLRMADLEARIKDLQQEMEPWKTSDCTHVFDNIKQQNACDVVQRLSSELASTKSELVQEKKNLESMQEDARKMGFANSVYNPN